MAKKFYVDNMTVQDILNIDPRKIGKMNERELSRALRTASLAANKRIRRLQEYAKKNTASQVALDALRWVTQDGERKKPFGVQSVDKRFGEEKRMRAMRAQLRDIRQFMKMQSSTITGAKELRRTREKALFGKTAEQAGRGKSKKVKAKIQAHYNAMYNKVWEYYYKYMELAGMDPHSVWSGSDEIIAMIGHGIAEGKSEEEIITNSLKTMKEQYETNMEEYNETFGDNWNDFGSFDGNI